MLQRQNGTAQSLPVNRLGGRPSLSSEDLVTCPLGQHQAPWAASPDPLLWRGTCPVSKTWLGRCGVRVLHARSGGARVSWPRRDGGGQVGEACLTQHMGLPGAPQETGAFKTEPGRRTAPSPGKRAGHHALRPALHGDGQGRTGGGGGASYGLPSQWSLGRGAGAASRREGVHPNPSPGFQDLRHQEPRGHEGKRRKGAGKPHPGPCSGPSCFLQTPRHSGLLLMTLWPPWPPVQEAREGRAREQLQHRPSLASAGGEE